MTKKGPWNSIKIPPEVDAEHQKELRKKRKEAQNLEEKIQKQIEEDGYYRMDDEDDIIEILETLIDRAKKT